MSSRLIIKIQNDMHSSDNISLPKLDPIIKS